MFRDRCPNDWLEESWGDDHRTFHTTAESFINRYGRAVWDKAYTFSVVRHPLARQVSNFFFLASICDNMPTLCDERHIPQHVRMDVVKNLTDKQRIESFHEWISDLYKAYPPGHPDQYLFGSRAQGNDENASFNSTQTSWLVDDSENIVVKDVFQLEHIDEAMVNVAGKIPCLHQGDEILSNDRSLESNKKGSSLDMYHENATPKYPNWKLFAYNQHTRKIMEEVYAVDFQNFGYKWPP